MRIKKMRNLLKKAMEKNPSLYNEEELNYMKEQLELIDGEIKRLQHKDYKGFGKNYDS